MSEESATNTDDQTNPYLLEQYAQHHFNIRKKGFFSAKKISIRELIQWEKSVIPKSLVKDAPKSLAVQIFKLILQYMGDKPLKEESEKKVAQKIIEIGITCGPNEIEIRDEIYCQISKQVTFNPSIESTHKGWDLLTLAVQFVPPTKELCDDLVLFFQEQMKINEDDKIPLYAKYCSKKIVKIQSEGAKGRVPSEDELVGLLVRDQLLDMSYLDVPWMN
jgi:hypothetical protein